MDKSEFMRGGCFAFALYLHEKTGKEIYFLVDENDWPHHAFVGDGITFYDSRGKHDKHSINYYKGYKCAGNIIRKSDKEEVLEMQNETGYFLEDIKWHASRIFSQNKDLNQLKFLKKKSIDLNL